MIYPACRLATTAALASFLIYLWLTLTPPLRASPQVLGYSVKQLEWAQKS